MAASSLSRLRFVITTPKTFLNGSSFLGRFFLKTCHPEKAFLPPVLRPKLAKRWVSNEALATKKNKGVNIHVYREKERDIYIEREREREGERGRGEREREIYIYIYRERDIER